ncbi:MAG: preprotein translocase subunit SecG [Betaproteobacteria bacterium]|nr:MAG: preprotein translocase subunit SecG [Betaproteobacteria bacterium]
MSMWFNVAIVVHILVAAAIIGLVLLQHGKGADMGSGFGGGASGSLFGATGSANFLSRTTAALATVFFLTSLALAYLVAQKPGEAESVVDRLPATQQKAPPAQPAAQPEKPSAPQPEKSVPQ